MVDHIEEFRIQFEQAENVFFTGENICGQILLKFSSPSQIRDIQMTLTGKGTEFLPIKRRRFELRTQKNVKFQGF